MPLGFSWGSDAVTSAPLFGDNAVRRPLSVLRGQRRQSAPPRPPRPELFPWSQADLDMPVRTRTKLTKAKPQVEIEDRHHHDRDRGRSRSVSNRDMPGSYAGARQSYGEGGRDHQHDDYRQRLQQQLQRQRQKIIQQQQHISAYDFARSDPDTEYALRRRATAHPVQSAHSPSATALPAAPPHLPPPPPLAPPSPSHTPPQPPQTPLPASQSQVAASRVSGLPAISPGRPVSVRVRVSPPPASRSQSTGRGEDRHVSPPPPVARNNSPVRSADADRDDELEHAACKRVTAVACAAATTYTGPSLLAAEPHALRRRPFSFESMRSAVSDYSLAPSSAPSAARPEQLNLPYKPAQIYDEYADIAMSNPFAHEAESVLHPARARVPYGPDDYYRYRRNPDIDLNMEASRKSSQARPSDYSNPPATASLPLSRFNSNRAPRPADPYLDPYMEPGRGPYPGHSQRDLVTAWEEVKRAVAPKLKVAPKLRVAIPPPIPIPSHRFPAMAVRSPATAIRSPATAFRSPTARELPPSPPPPPIPSRNPRRQIVLVQPEGQAAELEAPVPSPANSRLQHSRSSPSMAKTYGTHAREAAPPMPPMPPMPLAPRKTLAPVPAASIPVNIPAALPTPARSDCSSDGSDGYLSRSPDSYTANSYTTDSYATSYMHRDPSRFSADSDYSIPSPITEPSIDGRSDSAYSHHEKPLASPVNSPLLPPAPHIVSPLLPPAPHLVSPLLPPATSLRSQPQLIASSLTSPTTLPSPTSGRGFHEPPPVPPMPSTRPKPTRHSTVVAPQQPSQQHSRGWSDSRVGLTTTTIWAGSAPPVSHLDAQTENAVNESMMARQDTLRSVAPGESASRQSYQPPVTTPTVKSPLPAIGHWKVRESVVAGSDGAHVVQKARRVEDDFEPIKVISLPDRKKGKPRPAGDNMPKFSNNFAGFCKGAWRLQTAQHSRAFSLRTTQRKATLPNSTVTTTKTTTIRCGKCSFEGPLARHPATLSGAAAYAPSIDYLACADTTPRTAHGVVYRWSFLFKSHISSKIALRKDEMLDLDDVVYGCLFCCSEGKGTVCFKGVDTLCGHIASHHPHGVDLDPELKARLNIVVGRQPAKGEDWDLMLPGRLWGQHSQV